MSINVRGARDDGIDQVVDRLREFERQHPNAVIDVYRQNSVSIRVRIIEADFTGLRRADRHDLIWKLLEDLPEEIQSEVGLLLLLTPDEQTASFANFEFENPVPSGI